MLNILVLVSKTVVFMKHKPTLHIHLNTLKPPVIFQLYLADRGVCRVEEVNGGKGEHL